MGLDSPLGLVFDCSYAKPQGKAQGSEIEVYLSASGCRKAKRSRRAARSGAGDQRTGSWLTERFAGNNEARTNSYLVRASTFLVHIHCYRRDQALGGNTPGDLDANSQVRLPPQCGKLAGGRRVARGVPGDAQDERKPDG